MMIPSEGTVPYPYQEEIGIDEDGVGFALRMAVRNGITFSQLARKFASTGHLTLPASAAGSLAFMFGGDPARVQAAFMQRYVRNGASGVCFFGHDFRRPYHLRQTSPQVCPACISLHSHAPVAWSISMVTSCPTHGIRLLDHCACGRSIRWRRPSMDLCECGRRLGPSHQICRDATAQELAITSQAMYLLGPPSFLLRPSDSLFGVFDRLSVDTFVRLIWIFGIVDGDDPKRLPRCANKVLTTLEASMVKAYVCRAAEWVTREAMQIHGGMGYAEEFPVSRYFVDARVLSIFEGADETLCLKVIIRRLLEQLG